MSDKLYTEKEVIMRERAAANNAVEWVFAEARRCYGINVGIEGVDGRNYAENAYPLPKVTRPRVVKDCDSCGEWCVIAGSLRYRSAGGEVWHAWNDFHRNMQVCAPLPGRVKLWADLLANPNETVEE